MKPRKHRSEIVVRDGLFEAVISDTLVAVSYKGNMQEHVLTWMEWNNFVSRVEQAKEAFRLTLTTP